MKAITTIFIGLILSGFTVVNKLPNQDKAPVRVYLEHFRKAEVYQLSVRVLAKTDKRYRPAEGVEVALYTSDISAANLLGTIVTASNGTAIYTFTQAQFEVAKNTKIAKYYAVVDETEHLKSKQTSITIEDVNLSARYLIEDSVKQVYVHVSQTDSLGNAVPQKGVEIKVLVKRPLSPLPISDEYNTTDKEGNVMMAFPDDLPGDKDGNLKILVRIVEDEKFGTVEISEIKKWGVPTFISDKTLKRSLWASGANAPIPLLVFINALIISVWGMIIYMVIEIFRIRKIGKL
jgi:5-hydroxyisourate hydrolase-like protein (transthyretin family)